MGWSYVTTVERVDPARKAMALGNSQNSVWATLISQNASPGSVNPAFTATGPDGVYLLAQDLQYVPAYVFVQPYAQSGPGAQFSFRVYGWTSSKLPSGNPMYEVWTPFLIAEFACWTCNQPGPAQFVEGMTPPGSIQADEFFCDTMALVQGGIGPLGQLLSTGARDQGNPGTDLVARAKIATMGAKHLQFDFQQTDPIPMNLLFSLA